MSLARKITLRFPRSLLILLLTYVMTIELHINSTRLHFVLSTPYYRTNSGLTRYVDTVNRFAFYNFSYSHLMLVIQFSQTVFNL